MARADTAPRRRLVSMLDRSHDDGRRLFCACRSRRTASSRSARAVYNCRGPGRSRLACRAVPCRRHVPRLLRPRSAMKSVDAPAPFDPAGSSSPPPATDAGTRNLIATRSAQVSRINVERACNLYSDYTFIRCQRCYGPGIQHTILPLSHSLPEARGFRLLPAPGEPHSGWIWRRIVGYRRRWTVEAFLSVAREHTSVVVGSPAGSGPTSMDGCAGEGIPRSVDTKGWLS